jgi:hypothetical protein
MWGPPLIYARRGLYPSSANIRGLPNRINGLKDTLKQKYDRTFVLGVLCHELGHSMGATHTFFQRSRSSIAYTEPGMRDTGRNLARSIMGYYYGHNGGVKGLPYLSFTGKTYRQIHNFWTDIWSNGQQPIPGIDGSWRNPNWVTTTDVLVNSHPNTSFPGIRIANLAPVITTLSGTGGRQATIPAATYFRFEAVMPNATQNIPAQNIICGFEQEDGATTEDESLITNTHKTAGPQFYFMPRRQPIVLSSYPTELVHRQEFIQTNMPLATRDLNFGFVVQQKNAVPNPIYPWATDLYTKSSWNCRIRVDGTSRFVIESAVESQEANGDRYLVVDAHVAGMLNQWEINTVRFKIVGAEQSSFEAGIPVVNQTLTNNTWLFFRYKLPPSFPPIADGSHLIMEPGTGSDGRRFIFYGRKAIVKEPLEEAARAVVSATAVPVAVPVGAGVSRVRRVLSRVFSCCGRPSGTGRSLLEGAAFRDRVVDAVRKTAIFEDVPIEETMIVRGDAIDGVSAPLYASFNRQLTIPAGGSDEEPGSLPSGTSPANRAAMYNDLWDEKLELPYYHSYKNVKVQRWLSVGGQTFYAEGPLGVGTLKAPDIQADMIWKGANAAAGRILKIQYDPADLIDVNGKVASEAELLLHYPVANGERRGSVSPGIFPNTGTITIAINNAYPSETFNLKCCHEVKLIPRTGNVSAMQSGIHATVRELTPISPPITAQLKSMVAVSGLKSQDVAFLKQLLVISSGEHQPDPGSPPVPDLDYKETITITGENAPGAPSGQQNLLQVYRNELQTTLQANGTYSFDKALSEHLIGAGKWKNVRVERIIEVPEGTVTFGGQRSMYSVAYINPNPGNATNPGGIVELIDNRVRYTVPYNGDITGYGPPADVSHEQNLEYGVTWAAAGGSCMAGGTAAFVVGAVGTVPSGGISLVGAGIVAGAMCGGEFVMAGYTSLFLAWRHKSINNAHRTPPQYLDMNSSGRQLADPSTVPAVAVVLHGSGPAFPMVLANQQLNDGSLSCNNRFPALNGVPQHGLMLVVEEHTAVPDASRPGYMTRHAQVISPDTFSLYPAVGNITYPNGGEQVPEGAQMTVTWNSNIAAEYKAAEVNLSISYDNGATWQLVANTENDGSYQMEVPQIPGCTSTACRLRVESVGHCTFFDESDNTFMIRSLQGGAGPSAPFTRTVDGYPEAGQFVNGNDIRLRADPAIPSLYGYNMEYWTGNSYNQVPSTLYHLSLYSQNWIGNVGWPFIWNRYGTLMLEVPGSNGYIDLQNGGPSSPYQYVDLRPADDRSYAMLRPLRACITTARLGNTTSDNAGNDTSVSEGERTTGIPVAEHLFSLYPNPTRDLVTINHPAGVPWIELYSSTGQRIGRTLVPLGSTRTTLTLSQLAPGTYLVRAGSYSARVTKY